MKRTWTKKLVNLQFEWTDECFRRALWAEYHPARFPHPFDIYVAFDTREMMEMLKEVDLPTHSESINARYLSYCCELDTYKLELIIEAYNEGKQRRSGATIEVMASELLMRSINSETRREHES